MRGICQRGHLVYAVAGTVFAAPLDVEDPHADRACGAGRRGCAARRKRTPYRSDPVWRFPTRAHSSTCLGQPRAPSALRNIVLESTPLKLPPADYVHPRVSPDGKVLAVGQNTGRESDIWTYDLSEQTEIRRLTFGGNNRFPVWSGDGRRVTFQSARDGDRAIFWQSADGASGAERLTKPAQGEEHRPESWSRDGTHLLFSVFKDAKFSLWVLTLDGKKEAAVRQRADRTNL